MKHSNDTEAILSRYIVLVFILGFAVRLFACYYTYVINSDGALYIHQARAIYYGQWDRLLFRSMGFLSIYPLLIVPAYAIFHDWIIAAKSVSFLFGSLTLIPVYFLLRQFCEKAISALCLLVFSLIPYMVDRSADVVRDPVYWFFVATGLCLFAMQIGKDGQRYCLILSCLSFLIATSARIEAVLFLAVSCLFILCFEKGLRIKKTIAFAIPLAILFLSLALLSTLFELPVKDIFRIGDIGKKLSAPFSEYTNIRDGLAELAYSHTITTSDFFGAFVQKVRQMVWLIALGTIFKGMVKAFFYPFFIIFLCGMMGLWSRIKDDQRVLYFFFLIIAAAILLYIHVLQTWTMEARFFAVIVLPSAVFLGFGLENIIHFLTGRFNLRPLVSISLICLLILTFGLTKDLKPREEDKLVFKEIGEFIDKREDNGQAISVATFSPPGLVSFYANLKYPGAPSPEIYADFRQLAATRYDRFVHNLKTNHIKYFLWEERNWPREAFNFLKDRDSKDFLELGRWSHPDTGKLVLFRVR
jgi:4-amino-4-deoxy-L-arabinose transferase-like glycosyltransferase